VYLPNCGNTSLFSTSPSSTVSSTVTEDNPYLEIFKGLTEGGRLSPVIWGLILLYVDDICLIASSVRQLLEMMQTTQTWCENNLLTISTKSKVMVFHDTRRVRLTLEETQTGRSTEISPYWRPLSL
jgi:hypothetical protein